MYVEKISLKIQQNSKKKKLGPKQIIYHTKSTKLTKTCVQKNRHFPPQTSVPTASAVPDTLPSPQTTCSKGVFCGSCFFLFASCVQPHVPKLKIFFSAAIDAPCIRNICVFYTFI